MWGAAYHYGQLLRSGMEVQVSLFLQQEGRGRRLFSFHLYSPLY